jgi:hypothetical protein
MSDHIPAEDPTIAQPGFAAVDRDENHRVDPDEDELQIEEDRAAASVDADGGRTGADTPAETPESVEKAHIEEVDVEHVVERLTEKYSDLPAEVVEETVAEIHESFDDAAVRDFVPRLVEHDANEKLREVEAETSADDAD